MPADARGQLGELVLHVGDERDVRMTCQQLMDQAGTRAAVAEHEHEAGVRGHWPTSPSWMYDVDAVAACSRRAPIRSHSSRAAGSMGSGRRDGWRRWTCA